MQKIEKISWQALEHDHKPHKTVDWFWGLWIIAIGAIILCFYFGDILFGIIIILFTITAALRANMKPVLFDFEINRQGVRIGKTLYPYSNLESFWVEDTEEKDMIILRTRKSIKTILVLPFDSTKTNAEMVRDYLLDYLNEERMQEPLHHRFMEIFGF